MPEPAGEERSNQAHASAAPADTATEPDGRLRALQAEIDALRQRLEQANAELEVMASAASHDLRAPVRQMAMFADLLGRREGDKLTDKGREYLAFMERAGVQANKMIDGLIRLARLQKRFEPKSDVDLEVPMREALSNLSDTIRSTRANLTTDPLPRANVDAALVAETFEHVLANALKFRSQGAAPTITVTTTESADWIGIRFHDDGVGFQPSQGPSLTRLFRRAHTELEFEGHGVGLAIAHKAMALHGGTLEIDSLGVGQGATVTLRFPRRPGAAMATG